MSAPKTENALLRFLTCGSVDDGKSTLIGRLLYDSKLLFADQLETLNTDSQKFGTVQDGIDFALLVDGLEAEREQGITIDVAYRYFATPNRSFIVADTPGHEQYTRNMATGASTADVAVILVDARYGVVTQTRRHTFIAHLLGIQSIIVAVNKMDLVDYDQPVFDNIVADYQKTITNLGFDHVTAIPISALHGENITTRSDQMPWYDGPSVIGCLESAAVSSPSSSTEFRLPVQIVSRPDQDFRGYAGTVAGAAMSVGDPAVVAPAGTLTSIKSITAPGGEVETANPGAAVTITLADNIDASRGDTICHGDQGMIVTDQVQAQLIWMSDEPMIPGRQYLLKLATRSATAWVSELKHTVNVNTMEHVASKTLELNDIGVCNLSFDRRIACDAYADCHDTGSFILIDRFTYATVGAGMIDFSLRRARNLTLQTLTMDKVARARSMGQKPAVIWFTGLSGSGKSTVANAVESKLFDQGHRTYLLDGDNVRHGLNRDLGFTDADRVENIRRFGEVAKLFADAGLIVLVSVISPFRGERDMVRDLLDDGEFIEVFVDASLATCEQRDPKGLYARARKGEIQNFTGIDSPYEAPLNAELVLDTDALSPDDAADQVIALIEKRILED